MDTQPEKRSLNPFNVVKAPESEEITSVYNKSSNIPGKSGKKDDNSYVIFDKNKYMTFGQGDEEIKYEKRSAEEKFNSTSFASGQHKLLFCELNFLNIYFDMEKHKDPVIVYIGAANGTHTATIAKMYPMIKFELYDPEKFNLEALGNLENVSMYNRQFSESDTKHWKNESEKGRNIFLIVDIRNLNYRNDIKTKTKKGQQEFFENEKLVWEDMLLQEKWHREINPTKSLLKFRLPWYETFVTKTNYEYLDGIVYRQQYSRKTSSETRFVPYDRDENGKYKTRMWNIKVYENLCSYHNRIVRISKRFVNPFSLHNDGINEDDPIAEKLALYNDYDSTASAMIVMDYLFKFGISPEYDTFYVLFKNIDIDSGKNLYWNFNLRGRSKEESGGRFIDENGEEMEQKRKTIKLVN